MAKAIPNSILLEEKFKENPFLDKFYHEMARVGADKYNKYAFPVQMEFLKHRIEREAQNVQSENKIAIIDRCLLEDKLIFAENQRRNNLITEDEYLKYERYFDEHTQGLTHLDVLIYLSADVSVLAERIKNRNRKMEQSIDLSYLF